MKDILFNYYKFKIDNYKLFSDGIVFIVSDNKYYFCYTQYSEDELLKLNEYVRESGIGLHTFVYNINNNIKSDNYVLMKLNVLEYDIDIVDIEKFNSVSSKELQYVSMKNFWYKKIDFLSYQINELSNSKLIDNSFDYYVGISELILKQLDDNYESRIVLSHKKLSSLSSVEYYNPLNLSSDNYLKDYAYYIKFGNHYDLIDEILNNSNEKDIYYLFARLCFPFDYFDELSDIIIEKKDEKNLLKIITSVNDYENMLKFLEKRFNIYIYKWISIQPD